MTPHFSAQEANDLAAQLRALVPAARGMTADSRRVGRGDVFLAYPGGVHDGRAHIADAIHAGAGAVAWQPDTAAPAAGGFAWQAEWRVPHLPVADLKDRAAELAAAWYGHPSAGLWMTGITGTNGKTSVSHWLAQAYTALGRTSAVIGTLGNGFVDELASASHTTPDAVTLQGLLAQYRDAGAAGVAMEVSSHGLDQGRVAGVAFDVAVLTNLSRDHLDYHGDMASYAAAKSRLFHWAGLRCAVVNGDDELGVDLAAQLGDSQIRVLRYGLRARHAEIFAEGCHFDRLGMRLEIVTPWGRGELASSLLGEFNAYNLLATLGALLAGNVPLNDALSALSRVQAVAGRMQRVTSTGEVADAAPSIIVDFAHTPDALDKVLAALKPLTSGRLICVFGCGGGRDTGKRPLMGEVVARRADLAVVTSDNPRNEDPARIIDQILAGMPPGQVSLVDRREAIRHAIHHAGPDDIVVLAGKGHEDYQEIHGVKRPFSDFDEARAALAVWGQA